MVKLYIDFSDIGELVDGFWGLIIFALAPSLFFLEDARTVFVSYGSSARSALHVVKNRRARGESLGLLELQTLWPFPAQIVREKCAKATSVIVVEMNMGQVLQQVKMAVDKPENVYLANRIDGALITPTDIRSIMRLIKGMGV